MSREEISAKYHENARIALSTEQVDAVEEAVNSIDSEDNLVTAFAPLADAKTSDS